MAQPVDLRSDTVTRPTEAMRRAMAAAEVGDDEYGEDPTVRRLEEAAAEAVGKEAAVFVPSGVMGNQAAVMVHTRRGDEVIVEAEAHIYLNEVAGLARLSGVQARPIAGRGGFMPPEAIAAAIRPPGVMRFPRTGLLCLENTHNYAGGTVLDVAETRAMADVARARGIPVHLDGARIFNAAVALGVPAPELCAPADSVMFCLSKGLGAPVGSLVCGSAAFAAEARHARKALGGGMRQAGVLAAAGLIALSEGRGRLAEDHENARLLAEGLAGLPGLVVDPGAVQTNIVMARLAGSPPLMSAPAFAQALAEAGVKCNAIGADRLRFVTHRDVSRADCHRALGVIARVARERLSRAAVG